MRAKYRRRYSAETHGKAKAMLLAGEKSQSSIAFELKLTMAQIERIAKEMRSTGELGPERRYPTNGRLGR